MNRRELIEAFDDEMTKFYIECLESDDIGSVRDMGYFDFIRYLILMVHRAQGNHEKIVAVKERVFGNENN